MSVVIITGSAGLIGSEAALQFHADGHDVVGIDNDLRAYFFGANASTTPTRVRLERTLPRYRHEAVDIRDAAAVDAIFARHAGHIHAVIHTAAQPSHDWAAREPFTDFAVNATGTLHLLEAARRHAPASPFIFTSTNKVYGDTPNRLPLVERETRWEVDPSHPFAEHGIDETMSVDGTLHSLFGASKLAADVLVQEYGRYFGLPTVTFRGGCLTGPAHAGAELHGFLAWLVDCAVNGRPYRIFGYKGKQVRDNIHSHDFVAAVREAVRRPIPGSVYNMGGSRHSEVSMREAIALIEELGGGRVEAELVEPARTGDHIWYVSDVRRFRRDYPSWEYRYDIRTTLREIIDAAMARRAARTVVAMPAAA